MTSAIIHIKSIFGNTLDSRDEAIKLFVLLNSGYVQFQEIHLDFTAVDFMSRSFADQFHKEKGKLARDRTISIDNASNQVISILQAVSKTQNNSVKETKDLPVYSFSKVDQFLNYLQAI